MRSRRWVTGVTLAVLSLALAGCSSSTPAPTATTEHGTSPSTSSGNVNVTREASNPDPHFDFGFTILITEAGFEPHWLVSECCKDITWKNTTASPVTVAFDHQEVTSDAIPPGGTFVWLPKNIQSVTYHEEGDPSATGIIQVNQTFES